jgi:outer membrane immunogenic protein
VRKLLLGSAALVAVLAAPAMAADMGVSPAYKSPPPVVYNWTGFYIGGNAGYSAGDKTHAATTFDDGSNNIVNSFTLAPSGWVGGLQAGYNWQIGASLLGFEADWQWTGQKASFCSNNGSFCGDSVPGTGSFGTLNVERRLQWVSTARARFGWAHGEWLFYVTAGGAWGQVKSDISETCPDGCGPSLTTANNTSASFTSYTSNGWVLGGGVEMALAGNWTGKAEYLRLDLGTISNTMTGPGPYNVTLSGLIRDNIFRFGLNYRFGSSPVVAND